MQCTCYIPEPGIAPDRHPKEHGYGICPCAEKLEYDNDLYGEIVYDKKENFTGYVKDSSGGWVRQGHWVPMDPENTPDFDDPVVIDWTSYTIYHACIDTLTEYVRPGNDVDVEKTTVYLCKKGKGAYLTAD